LRFLTIWKFIRFRFY